MTKYRKLLDDIVDGLPFRVYDKSAVFWGIHKGDVFVDLITINGHGPLIKLCELFHELGHAKHFQSLNKRDLKRAEKVFHHKRLKKFTEKDIEFTRKCELSAWELGWKMANHAGLGKDKRFSKVFERQAIKDMKTYGMKVTVENGDEK